MDSFVNKLILILSSLLIYMTASAADYKNVTDISSAQPVLKLSCKFGSVYRNSNGKFKEVKNPTWPPFVKDGLNDFKGGVYIHVYTKKKLIKVGKMSFFVLLINEKKSPNNRDIRGYFLNLTADHPYLEAIIIDTAASPIEVTYLDGITGNIVLGVCKKNLDPRLQRGQT